MKLSSFSTAMILSSVLMTGCSSFRNATANSASTESVSPEKTANLAALSRYAPSWPETSQRAVSSMIEKYGNPEESTASMLIWRNTAPFKRIVVYRDATVHRFPLLHQDVIEHVIDYKVPVAKVGDVARFSGSILIDRTKGELSARSDKEGMNLLALNLVNDVIRGTRTPDQARTDYGRFGIDLMNGKKTTYSQSLQFGSQFNTADTDRSIDMEFPNSEKTEKKSRRQAQESKSE